VGCTVNVFGLFCSLNIAKISFQEVLIDQKLQTHDLWKIVSNQGALFSFLQRMPLKTYLAFIPVMALF